MKNLTKVKQVIDRRIDSETQGIIHVLRMVSEVAAYNIGKENEKLREMINEHSRR